MLAFILLQNFIHQEDINFIIFLLVLTLFLVALIGAGIITFIYKLIRKNVTQKRLILLLFISFFSLIILISIALIFFILRGF